MDYKLENNYLISQKFMTQWIMACETRMNSRRVKTLIESFEQEQYNLIENYIHKEESLNNLSALVRTDIVIEVNYKVWYFFWFLYNDFSRQWATPLMIKTNYIKDHAKLIKSDPYVS